MRRRSQLAILQIATFVAGGVLAPVVHVAWHRPDHAHGRAAAFEVHPSRGSARPHRTEDLGPESWSREGASRPEHAPEAGGHGSPHGHPHPHPGSGQHATEATPAVGEDPAPPGPGAEPLETSHGHGSLAHLGLALLSAPPPVPLPTPRLMGALARREHPRVAALFHPGFPLPRPPPTNGSS